MSGRPASAWASPCVRSSASGPGASSPSRASGSSGDMPASSLSWRPTTSTRLLSMLRLASRRLTSTRTRLSSSAGAAPCWTRSRTRERPWRFVLRSSSVKFKFRRAARRSPAFRRTSLASRRSRSLTCACFMSISRSATPTRPACRPLRSSGMLRPTVTLLSDPDALAWPPRSSIGFGRRPAWSRRPRAASTSARMACSSGLPAIARSTT